MDNNYLGILTNIYRRSSTKTIVTDKDFNVLWVNDVEYEKLLINKTAFCIFEEGIKIPISSAVYCGVLNGVPYRYNVIVLDKNFEDYIIIELVSEDILSDFYKFPSVMNYFININADMRQAVFEISNAALNINDTLDAIESYNEISLVNCQMRDCYKILRATMNIQELFRYIHNNIDKNVFNLSKYMHEIEKSCERILSKTEGLMLFEIEDGLYLEADRERLSFALVNAIIHVIKNYKEVPIIKLSIKKVSNDILISVANIGSNKNNNLTLYKFDDMSSIAFDMELYIVKLFCNNFNGNLYISKSLQNEEIIGIRLPVADESDFNKEFNTSSPQYASNKFSPFYVALADIYNYDFF